MRKILPQAFFIRPAPEVAERLLGKYLVRRLRNKEYVFQIRETEAYDGFRDRGSHAYRGETRRTRVMFGPPGYFYIYFTYGMHWLLNIVTREAGYPSAILVRAVRGINGPARLTKMLSIDGSLNGKPAGKKTGLWVEDRGTRVLAKTTRTGPRIGINYAGPYWKRRKWRFWIEEDKGARR